MAFSAIEDQLGSIEVVVFPNLYVKTHTLLADEAIVIMEAEVQKNENMVKLIAEKIVPVDQASEEWTNGVLIQVDAKTAGLNILDELKTVIQMHPGDCEAFLKIKVQDDVPPALIKLGEDYQTTNEPMFFEQVEKITGKGTIETRCAAIKEKVRKKKPWLNKKG
jgi:DNA polymerase-3 subunit alpha